MSAPAGRAKERAVTSTPRSVKVAERANEANVVSSLGGPRNFQVDHFEAMQVTHEPDGEKVHEVNAADLFAILENNNQGHSPESLAALDSACNRTVCGPLWLEQALERVPGRLKHLVASVEESEKFRFVTKSCCKATLAFTTC